MTSLLKFFICGLACAMLISSPGFAGEKKAAKEKKDYSESEFDSLEDTSSSGWKEGTGSKDTEAADAKKKEPCPKGQIRGSNGKCRDSE
ncbi:MAG: hypothetical protein ABL958_03330 [Bdellovibrionia bacterium]